MVLNSFKDKNKLTLNYLFDVNFEKYCRGTHTCIAELFCHEGAGGLYQTLFEKGYLVSNWADDNSSFMTICNQFYVGFTLTDLGIKNWKEVLQIYEKFIQTVDVSNLPLFEEHHRMNETSFKYYKVPEQAENVQNLSSELVYLSQHPESMHKIIKFCYDDR